MSYEFKGTPGSWVQQYGELRGSNKKPVTVWGLGIAHGGRSEESEANARAITELPELIDAGNSALESLLFSRQELRAQASIPDADEQQIQDAIDALRQALTKATGGGDV